MLLGVTMARVPVCVMNEKGYCERHQRIHNAGERPWAVDTTPVGDAFRLEWDKQTKAQQAGQPELSPKTSEVKVELNTMECRHFSDTPYQRKACGSCERKWIYPCEIHGKCSPDGEEVGVKTCNGCAQFVHRDNVDTPECKAERLILNNPLCPGDVVVMSAAIRSLHMAHPGKYITAVTGTATEVYHYNPDISPVTPGDFWRTIKMEYPLINQSDTRPVHFMQGYCEFLSEVLGVHVPLLVNRPYVYVSKQETEWINQVEEITSTKTRFWLVNAGFKDDYPAKWWGSSNFQDVVNHLRGQVLFVQIGENNHHHPKLDGVIDLRGKTDVRQLVRLVYHCAGALGPSTFLQHLCAGLDRPYVLIAGGREPLIWQHYPRQTTLSTIGNVGCSFGKQARACWRDHTRLPETKVGTFCELPTLTRADEWIPACLSIIKPTDVAQHVLAKYNLDCTVKT